MENQLIFTLIRDGGTLLVLAFFIRYFMLELVKRDIEISKLNTAFLEQEIKMISTISSNTDAFNKLTECIMRIEKSLQSIISKNKQ